MGAVEGQRTGHWVCLAEGIGSSAGEDQVGLCRATLRRGSGPSHALGVHALI